MLVATFNYFVLYLRSNKRGTTKKKNYEPFGVLSNPSKFNNKYNITSKSDHINILNKQKQKTDSSFNLLLVAVATTYTFKIITNPIKNFILHK